MKKTNRPDARGQSAKPTETFWTRNVKTITFFVCLGIFLAVLGPISAVQIYRYVTQKDDRPQMTLEDVIRLSDLREPTLAHLTVFAGEEKESETGIYYYVDLEGNGYRYALTAIANPETKKLFYCSMINLTTQKITDVLKDDVREYLKTN